MSFKCRVLEVVGWNMEFVPIGVVVAPGGGAPFVAKYVLNSKSISALPEHAFFADLALDLEQGRSLDRLEVVKAFRNEFWLAAPFEILLDDRDQVDALTVSEQVAADAFRERVVRHAFYQGVHVSATSSELAA